jgi:hypothetical protein
MSFNALETAALAKGTRRIGVFFLLETDTPVALWLGYGKIRPGINVFDPVGREYKGFGELQNVPAVKQLLNGSAMRQDFVLSGVKGDVLDAIASDSEAVKGKPVRVGYALMDEDWQLLGPIHWLASYTADYIGVSQPPTQLDQPIVRTITLSCGTRNTGKRRPLYGYFTDADQQARSPGDKFCSLVPNYSRNFLKAWPKYA